MLRRLFPALLLVASLTPALSAADRPNILWISAEDLSPDLGCYGDAYARTPHLDRFATESVRYTRCFTHAGVCAPSRSGLITGMYPPSIGTQHMRCKGVPPAVVKCFPEYLRQAGYYCTNNSKTDYQFDSPGSAWDESSGKAHWKQRADGQPFFAVFNFTTSHESQARNPSPATQKLITALPDALKHDPAQAVLPPFWPDTSVVRRNYADYADTVSAMDTQVGEVLRELEAAGLADDTIVWFWGDHGRGLTRCKRWLYDSGTHVPLLVRVPEKYRTLVFGDRTPQFSAGSTCDDLVAFVDFAPTMLTLAGVSLPRHFQGQPFLGPEPVAPRQYVYGHRDRMDEAYDCIRMVRDKRFKYLRNFLSQVSYGQDISYMNEMPILKEMRRMHAEGTLAGPPELFFRPTKPVEELFDTEADPDELTNLADRPEHRATLLRFRTELDRWMREIGDTALLPEPMLDELKRPGGVWAVTAAPGIARDIAADGGGRQAYRVYSNTPGASIGWRRNNAGAGNRQTWLLPDAAGRVLLDRDEQIELRAFRLGNKDSEIVPFQPGDEDVAAKPDVAPVHWREALFETGELERAKALKDLELQPGDHTQEYVAALTDSAGSVRWWAVWQLTDGAKALPAVLVSRFEELVTAEQSPAVQILLVQTLLAAGSKSVRLSDLTQRLEDPQDSVGLHAAIALNRLGELARPAIPELRKAVKAGEYVGRVSTTVLEHLGVRP
ncbi:sulfatase-like hydrolase/transferase [Planctellipticum variicoloris]|uniref:sulfatase-like hydrolase/transferase n=1 Tax=Planctellipticum variicoloris TaxID=3064265 RepID=UPI003013B1B5|nr:sulfatase-like hydrolase/transferase [Planctomycetaceae bacterium SH412]